MAQIHNVVKTTVLQSVHVFLDILAHLQLVDQNVFQTVNVRWIKLASIRNVSIHVLEHVEFKLYAKQEITIQRVAVQQVTMETHLLDVNKILLAMITHRQGQIPVNHHLVVKMLSAE